MDLPTPADLRERRNELELTQSELADRADVSQPLIARIEGGDVDPRLSTLRRIVSALAEAETGIVRAEDLMHSDVINVAPDDELAIAIALGALGGYDPDTVRIARIQNTTDLSELHVSPALLEAADADLEVLAREELVFEGGTMRFVPQERRS